MTASGKARRAALDINLLTPKQQEVWPLLCAPQRHTMLYGGARSTKTWLIVAAIIGRAIRAPGSRHAIFRYNYNHCRASVWMDTFPKVVGKLWPNMTYDENKSLGIIYLPTEVKDRPAEIWFGGLEEKQRTEKILGMEFVTFFLNECSQINYAEVLVLLTRLAQNVEVLWHGTRPGPLMQRAYYDENPPEEGHWTYRQFIEDRDPVTGAPLANPAQYRAALMNPADNPFLSDAYKRELQDLPERSRLRFWEGRFSSNVEGQLFPLSVIERSRWPEDVPPPPMRRIVVAIDPSGTRGTDDTRSDEVGIEVCGLSDQGLYWALEDLSTGEGPEGWAAIAIAAFQRWRANTFVCEVNYGGDLVAANLRQAWKRRFGDHSVAPIVVVHASRGKAVRAEPVSAIFESGNGRIVGRQPKLEDQLAGFRTSGYVGTRSPDRADAMVWGFTHLSQGAVAADAGAPVAVEGPSPAAPIGPSHGGRAAWETPFGGGDVGIVG